MAKHYILRVGDGENFRKGSEVNTWAVRSGNTGFLKNVNPGDKLWFITKKQKGDVHRGKIIAVADFVAKNMRVFGPLISTSKTNEDLGWDEKGGVCDVEIHYNNLYNLTECKLFTGQKNQTTISAYDNFKERLLVNLEVEYEYICKYSKIKLDMS